MADKKKTLYFSTLRNENNDSIDYDYKPPVYGASNTDPSYYEPQASRIANMRNSASAVANGAYDFDENKKVNLNEVHIPIGRAPGMTFEEISQLQTINNARIKKQNDENVQADKEAEEAKKQLIENTKTISENLNSNSEE